MPTREPSIGEEIHQIKVSLRWTKPEIWRRLLVPSNITLAELHNILQIAMGWQNGHLHEFRVNSKGQAKSPSAALHPSLRLGDVLKQIESSVCYLYDFGDGWEHDIVLEQRLLQSGLVNCPACVDGQYACPPEDCGGVPCYYDLLKILRNPKHKQFRDIRDWVGDGFDPQFFSIDAVNRRLSPARKRHKDSG